MEELKTDRRVRKTRKLIRSALTSLLLEKPVGDITVREIAERADINRGTFYSHYKDVSDLLGQIEENVLAVLEEVNLVNEPRPNGDAYPYLCDLLRLVSENQDIYMAIICRNGDLDFQERIYALLKEQFLRGYFSRFQNMDPDFANCYCAYIASGLMSFTKAWLISASPAEPELAARMADDFLMRGIEALKD